MTKRETVNVAGDAGVASCVNGGGLPRSDAAHLAKVLVVGGSGFIGSVLVRKLLDQGHTVRVLDNFLYGDFAIRGALGHSRLQVVRGDARDLRAVIACMSGVDAVVHLGGIVGDGACQLDPTATVEVNYCATRLLAEVALGFGISRFIFASSCSVYGATDETMDERSVVAPVSLYGRTKVESEYALLSCSCAAFQPTILRLATVFGHSYRPRFDLSVNLLTARAHTENLIRIQNGRNWRPFIHVSDVANGMCMVLGSPLSAVGRQIFNLGDTEMNHRLCEIGEKVRHAFPSARMVSTEDGDRRNYCVNFSKVREAIGFRHSRTIEDGIEEIRGVLGANEIGDYADPRYDNLHFLREADCRPLVNQNGHPGVASAFLSQFESRASVVSRAHAS